MNRFYKFGSEISLNEKYEFTCMHCQKNKKIVDLEPNRGACCRQCGVRMRREKAQERRKKGQRS